MKTPELLHAYKNGNVNVEIYEDGTKIREWSDDETPWAEYPESADVKITNFCNLGSGSGGLGICRYCHEQSNTLGKHADLSVIEKIWSTQKPGTEMAIGGGNPLSHPDIKSFLTMLKSYGVISNVTMNVLHMKEYASMIKEFQEEKLIYGLGISYRGLSSLKQLPDDIEYKNVVMHMILGVHTLDDCKAVIAWGKARNIKPKILLLGFKQYGNGATYYNPALQAILDTWKDTYLKEIFKNNGIIVSFDNLALEQLDLKNQISKDMWDECYMGQDGSSTMYIDAVKQECARTSTSMERFKFDDSEDIRDLFAKVKI